MMKRFSVTLLSVAIAANLVACGCGTTNNNGAATEQDSSMDQPAAAPEDTPAEMPETGEETGQEEAGTEGMGSNISGDTVGSLLVEEFHALKAENTAITAQEMAEAIIANPMIQFEGAAMEVEEGLLTGFGNTEITGFTDGVMFAPMIGSIPFVGYVFTLEDGADAEAFMQVLKDNADPRWNICVEAEETVVENADNMVFFVMCPSQFE